MPYTEMDNITLTKLALISERARKEPDLQFTSLAHLLNVGFPKGFAEHVRNWQRGKKIWDKKTKIVSILRPICYNSDRCMYE